MSFSNASIGPDRLDSELLRTFLAIAETGSFTRGAERIFRSQSAASLQIKRLEEILGQPVFERHARGVALSDAGEKLRPVARRVVEMLDLTLGDLKSDSIEGSLRVGIPEEYGGSVLPGLIAEFARDHPRVELSVRCGFSAGFPEALENDELDLAVHSVETASPSARILARERTVWAASRHHAPEDRDPLPVALYDRDCWWRDRALEALQAAGKRFRVVYTSESETGVTAAIVAGAAVGLIGENALREDLRVLAGAEGFPDMPDSLLVLDQRKGSRSKAVEAFGIALVGAFGAPA